MQLSNTWSLSRHSLDLSLLLIAVIGPFRLDIQTGSITSNIDDNSVTYTFIPFPPRPAGLAMATLLARDTWHHRSPYMAHRHSGKAGKTERNISIRNKENPGCDLSHSGRKTGQTCRVNCIGSLIFAQKAN